MPDEPLTAALAEWAAAVRQDELPASCLSTGALLAADTIAAIARGSTEQVPSRVFGTLSAQHGSGAALALRPGLPATSAMASAVANSVAGTWFELDPGHQSARTHAPIHVLPALLAYRPDTAPTWAEFLVAFITGVEVGYRLGGAVTPRKHLHPHGLWATVGAAAGVSRLAGLSASQTRWALATAAHLMLTTTGATTVAGASVRTALPGLSAVNAGLAVDLVRGGVRGLANSIEVLTTTTLASGLDPSLATGRLGDEFRVEQSYFKVHACCHHLAAAADAAIAVRAAERWGPAALAAPATVRTIEVGTYPVALRYAAPQPVNAAAALFSIPYVVSAALLDGRVGPAQFAADRLADRRRRALERTISVTVDPAAAQAYPLHREASVTVTLTDGRRLQARCPDPLGTPANPVPEQFLRAKFESLAGDVLPSPGTAWRGFTQPSGNRLAAEAFTQSRPSPRSVP